MERDEIREALRVVLKELGSVAQDVTSGRSDTIIVTGLNGMIGMLGNLVNDIHADANPNIIEEDGGVELSNLPKSRPAFKD